MNKDNDETKQLEKKFLEACRECCQYEYVFCDYNFAKVKSLAYYGVDVNSVSDNGRCGLSIAARGKHGHLMLVKFLLSQPKIDVNIKVIADDFNMHGKSSGKWTPLMFACAYGKHEMVEKLVQIPTLDLTYGDDDGYTALHLAAMKGHYECLKALSTVRSLDWDCKDKQGRTPLYSALWFGHVECVKILASLPNLDFNVKTVCGETLASAAIIGSKVECIQILADIETFNWNILDQFGDSPLMTTLKKGKREMFDILVNCPWVDLGLRDSNGDTPSMWAYKNGLIDQGKKLETLLPSRASNLAKLRAAIPWEHRKKVPECPVCMDPFARDGRIFHCVSGHFICEACKLSLATPLCPKCKQAFSGRAHDFEEIVSKSFY